MTQRILKTFNYKSVSLFWAFCFFIASIFASLFLAPPMLMGDGHFYIFPFSLWFAIIFLIGIQYWPMVWLAATIVGYLEGGSLLFILVNASCLTAAFAGTQHYYFKLFKRPLALNSILDLLYFIGICFVTATLTGAIYVALKSLDAAEPFQSFLEYLPGTIGRAMSRSLLLIPVLLIWKSPPKDWFHTKKIIELSLYVAVWCYVGWYLFSPSVPYTTAFLERGYILFALVLLVGIRFGAHGVMLLIGITYLQARLWATNQAHFYYLSGSDANLIRTFLSFLSLSGVLIAFTLNDLAKKTSALNLANALFKGIIELIPIPMIVVNGRPQSAPGQSGSTDFVNHSFTQLTGFDLTDFSNQKEWWTLAYPDSIYRAQVKTTWDTNLKNAIDFSMPVEALESWITCKNGQRRYMQWCAIFVQNNYVIYANDLTESKAQANSLKIAASLYQAIGDSVVITNIHNAIVAVNPSFQLNTGYSEAEVLEMGITTILLDDATNPVFLDMWKELESMGRWEGQVTLQVKDGTLLSKFLSVYATHNENTDDAQRIWLFSDITRHKKTRAIIHQQANYDSLTGLPNRRLMNERLERAIARADESKTGFALIYVDIDNFKDINDTQGHDIGDQVLVAVSKLFTENIRSSDTVSRLGGDEFTLIVNSIKDREGIETILNNIFQKFENPIVIENNAHHISLSAGIALYPTDASDSRGMLMRADQAMYAAKSEGKDGHHFFNRSLQDTADKKVTILNDLRRGLKEHEFELLYQPIVDLATGKIYKAEALIRWKLPDGSIRLPGDFLPIAEESGVIVPIGEWVFKSVVSMLSRLKHTHPDFSISINISPVQFHSRLDFSKRWAEHVEAAGIRKGTLCLEITERLMLKINPIIQKRIKTLQQAGMEFSVDDFGTGYSSLAMLQRMKFNYIKMDKIFIDPIVSPSSDLALVEAVLAMANGLDLRTVAEGVETNLQLETLRRLGCQYGQGYLLHYPYTEDKLIAVIEQDQAK